LNTNVSVRGVLDETKDKMESYFLLHNETEGVKNFTIKDIEQWKQQIELNFVFNYKTIRNSAFFNELTPSIQGQLLNYLIQKELKFFPYLFYDFGKDILHDGMQLKMSMKVIYKMLSFIENDELMSYESENRMIVKVGEEFSHFIMIRKGIIKCFDENFSYMVSLEEGSFFGEYNIMFGLYSQLNYQMALSNERGGQNLVQLFKIEKDKLMQALCIDFHSFLHFHKLSIQKLRFTQRMMKQLSEQHEENEKIIGEYCKKYN